MAHKSTCNEGQRLSPCLSVDSQENQESVLYGDTSELDSAVPKTFVGHESGSLVSGMTGQDQHGSGDSNHAVPAQSETGKDIEPNLDRRSPCDIPESCDETVCLQGPATHTSSIVSPAFEALPNHGAKCEETRLPIHHQFKAGSKQSIASGSNFLGSYESGTRTMPMTLARLQQLRHVSEGTSLSSLYTPLSFRSDTPYIAMIDSAQTFFHVLPHAVEESAYLNKSSPAFDSYIKENSERFKTLTRSRETADMVEKCFQKKIKPVFLLTILYGLRKSDPVAKAFVRQLPAKVVYKIKTQLHS